MDPTVAYDLGPVLHVVGVLNEFIAVSVGMTGGAR
jgi:hypothetical protein